MSEYPTSRDAFQQSYLDFIDGLIPAEPPMDGLDDEDRAAVQRWLAFREAAEGIDPLVSLPSVDELLTRAGAVEREQMVADIADNILDHLRAAFGDDAGTVVMNAAVTVGAPTDLVVTARGVRLPCLVADPEMRIEAAFSSHLGKLSAVFGGSPAANSVVLICPTQSDGLATIVDRTDVLPAVETPSGHREPPHLSGPVDHPATICVRHITETVLEFGESRVGTITDAPPVIELAAPQQVAEEAVRDLVATGERARTNAKQVGYCSLDQGDVAELADLVRRACDHALDEEDLTTWLATMSEAA